MSVRRDPRRRLSTVGGSPWAVMLRHGLIAGAALAATAPVQEAADPQTWIRPPSAPRPAPATLPAAAAPAQAGPAPDALVAALAEGLGHDPLQHRRIRRKARPAPPPPSRAGSGRRAAPHH